MFCPLLIKRGGGGGQAALWPLKKGVNPLWVAQQVLPPPGELDLPLAEEPCPHVGENVGHLPIAEKDAPGGLGMHFPHIFLQLGLYGRGRPLLPLPAADGWVAGHWLLQKLPGGLHPLIPQEAALHGIFKEGVVQGGKAHPHVVGHIALHHS